MFEKHMLCFGIDTDSDSDTDSGAQGYDGYPGVVDYKRKAGNRGEGITVKDVKLLFVFFIAIVLMLLPVGCEPYTPTEGSLVGQTAPQFTLKDLDGHDVSLQQYRGKIVMLDFWATWCGPCRMSMPMLEKIQDQYSGKLVLLAVNLEESKDLVKQYALSQNLGSKVLLDRDGSVGGMYGVVGIPMQVLIDQKGTVKFVVTGTAPGMDSEIRAQINKLL